MNLHTIILLIFLSLTNNKRDKVLVKTDIYEIVYSEVLEQPLNIKYTISCKGGEYKRDGMDFYKVPSLHTSDDLDYKNNVWDKGHMVPATSFDCTEYMLHQTFSYANCSLQHQQLNGGVWKSLEYKERELSKEYTVEVEIICVFSSKSAHHMRSAGSRYKT